MRFMLWLSLCFAASALAAGTASAQESSPPTKLFVEISAGAAYGFPDQTTLPSFDNSSINSTYTFGVSRSDWTLAFSYVEAKNDQEGNQVALGYENRTACGLVRIARLGCSLGLQVRDIEGQETVRYSAGIRRTFFSEMIRPEREHPGRIGLNPGWTLSGAALSGDRTETTAQVGLDLPITFDERRPNEWRWTLRGTASVVHAFEADTTLPTWGVTLQYSFTSDVSLQVGYESRVVLDPLDENDLDVDRSATARFKYRF